MRAAGLLLLALSLTSGGGPETDGAEDACDEARVAFTDGSRTRQGAGEEALRELIREVEGLIERFDGRAPVCAGRLRENESFLLILDGRLEEAARRIETYLASADQRASGRTRVWLWAQLGYINNQLGRTVVGARAYFHAASLTSEVSAGVGARAYVEAASTARKLGDLGNARRYLDDAFALIEDSLATNPELVSTRGRAWLSATLLSEVEYASATDPATRARAVQNLSEAAAAAYADLPRSPQTVGHRAVALNHRALALALGGDHRSALQQLDLAATLAEENGGYLPSAPYSILMTRSRICLLADDRPCAARSARMALEDARRRGVLLSESDALEQLGEVAEASSEWDEAERLYREALGIRSERRNALVLQDWSLTSARQLDRLARGLVRAHLAKGEVEEAFTAIESVRARHLMDLRTHQNARATASAEVRDEIDSLSTALTEARRLLHQADSPAERARASRASSELLTALREVTGASAPPALSVPALQSALRADGRALVSYVLGADQGVAFVVTADTLVAVPLAAGEEEVSAALRSTGFPWDGSENADPTLSLGGLHRLHEALLAPLERWVGTAPLVVVPDGVLATVPFAALVTAPATDYETAPYVVRERAITQELSSALVLESGPEPSGDAVVFARGQFDRSTWNEPLDDLPGAVREARAVSRRVGATSWLGERATEARLYADASRASVVHVATHAEPDPRFPLHSRIALSPDEVHDGTVHLYEWITHPMSAELVVLSGCSTGLGGYRGGEGVVSIGYGVRSAGARSTLATLWTVSDGSMETLMGALYRGLADGLPKDEALRQAQLDYLDRNGGIKASPYFWAAPVLSGTPRPLRVGRGTRWLRWTTGLAVGGLLVLGLAWAFLHRRRPWPIALPFSTSSVR